MLIQSTLEFLQMIILDRWELQVNQLRSDKSFKKGHFI